MCGNLPHRRVSQSRHVCWRDAERQAFSALSISNERPMMLEQKRVTVATVWLDGCSGCHMSLLDIDDRLIGLADKVDFVYSPLVDAKQLPESVDVGIIEG